MTEVERAAQKRCVFIGGQEDVLRARALNDILGRLGVLPDDFDVQTFDAPSSDLADWIGAAATAPFMGDRRVIVVRQLLQREPPKDPPKDAPKSAPKPSKSPFSGLPNTAMVILIADAVGGTEERRAKAKTWSTGWQKLVSGSDGAVLLFDPDPKRTREGVKAEASARGVPITERALDVLVEMTGGSLSRSIEEFEKLALFVGDAGSIGERQVEEIVVPSREWNVFKLIDAIFDHKPNIALSQLRSMIGSVSAESAAISQILPQVSRMVKLIWQGRLCIEFGTSLQNPSPQFLKALPKRPNLLELQPYLQSKVMRIARTASMSSLNRALSVVAETDAKIKGSVPSFSAMDSLEMMVFELAGAVPTA